MIGTKIEWATDTVNFFHGCQKVSPACQFCYAEAMDARFHAKTPHWGPDAPRLLRVEKALAEIQKIRKRAISPFYICTKCGWSGSKPTAWANGTTLCPACEYCVPNVGYSRPRVFINSMSDFFEDRRDLDEARIAALDAFRLAPEVDFLLLTKRPEKILPILVHLWETMPFTETRSWISAWVRGDALPKNLWLGTTCENQEWADKRIPELLKVPAAVRFISIEPMLGPVTFRWRPWSPTSQEACGGREKWKGEDHLDGLRALDWVICGSESGPSRRPFDVRWVQNLREQCKEAGVPFFYKQGSGFGPKGVTATPGLGSDPCIEFPTVRP